MCSPRAPRIVQMRVGPAFGRSPADPYFDPFWARLNEANVPLATHLGWTEYAQAGAQWSEDPGASYFHYDAFQWLHYWGDRPAMETVSALIFHGLFERFPNLASCCPNRERCGCRTSCARWTMPSSWGGARPSTHSQPAERDLRTPHPREPVSRGEPHEGGRSGGYQLPRLRFRLPARRRSSRPVPCTSRCCTGSTTKR